MENMNFDIDYEKLKDNNNGTIAFIGVVGVTATVAICKYCIDAVSKKGTN